MAHGLDTSSEEGTTSQAAAQDDDVKEKEAADCIIPTKAEEIKTQSLSFCTAEDGQNED